MGTHLSQGAPVLSRAPWEPGDGRRGGTPGAGQACGSLVPAPQVLAVIFGEQRVEEGVEAAVAVGPAGHEEVDGDDGGATLVPLPVPTDAEELPQPEGQEPSPGHTTFCLGHRLVSSVLRTRARWDLQ